MFKNVLFFKENIENYTFRDEIISQQSFFNIKFLLFIYFFFIYLIYKIMNLCIKEKNQFIYIYIYILTIL